MPASMFAWIKPLAENLRDAERLVALAAQKLTLMELALIAVSRRCTAN